MVPRGLPQRLLDHARTMDAHIGDLRRGVGETPDHVDNGVVVATAWLVQSVLARRDLWRHAGAAQELVAAAVAALLLSLDPLLGAKDRGFLRGLAVKRLDQTQREWRRLRKEILRRERWGS